ncbi:MAG: YlbF family regulator [Candidatus Fimivivens sp.]|nr:YlbF family regulator [Candidatus Fimivivens sp.]
MDIIKMARELGKAIQQDELYKKMSEASAATEKSPELQSKINEFSELRVKLNQEVMKSEGEKNEDLIAELDSKLRTLYQSVTEDPTMMAYNSAKAQLEGTLNFISQIITGSANGQDPDSIEQQTSCSGSCGSCGGCH